MTKPFALVTILALVCVGAFFTPDSAAMKADRVVAQIAAEAGLGLE